jgi:hypothetical protein
VQDRCLPASQMTPARRFGGEIRPLTTPHRIGGGNQLPESNDPYPGWRPVK